MILYCVINVLVKYRPAYPYVLGVLLTCLRLVIHHSLSTNLICRYGVNSCLLFILIVYGFSILMIMIL